MLGAADKSSCIVIATENLVTPLHILHDTLIWDDRACTVSMYVRMYVCTYVCTYVFMYVFNTSSLHSHCISYTGSVCSPFIENIDFFVNDSQRDILDDWAMAAFTEIRQLEGSVTTQGNQQHSKCVAFAKAVVCHSLYPYCDPSSNSPSPRAVCQNACNILTTGVCRGVFDALSSNVTELLTSNCDLVAKEGGDSPECIHVSLEHPQKNGE